MKKMILGLFLFFAFGEQSFANQCSAILDTSKKYSPEIIKQLEDKIDQYTFDHQTINEIIDIVKAKEFVKHPRLAFKILLLSLTEQLSNQFATLKGIDLQHAMLTHSQMPGLLAKINVSEILKSSQPSSLTEVFLRDNGNGYVSNVISAYRRLAAGQQRGFYHMMKFINPLESLYADRSEYVNSIANRLQANFSSVASTNVASQIPAYNKFKLIKENVRRSLGAEHENLQDVIFVRSKDSEPHRVIVFSNLPVNNKPLNWLGLSLAEIKTYPKEETKIDDVITWTVRGKKSEARVKFEYLNAVDIRPTIENSPRYTEMLADGKLGGMILIAKNLREFAPELAETYMDYFTDRGFEITQQTKMSAEKAYDLILERVKSGEIDYTIREGHSEFSPEAMVSFTPEVEVVQLTRKTPKQQHSEVVYLITPQAEVTAAPVAESRALYMSELGAALRSRTLSNQQFIYFDSACFAHDYTLARFEHTAAPGFVPIGSTRTLDTFTETKGKAAFEFINGIRRLRNYDEMSQRIEPNEIVMLPSMGETYMRSTDMARLRPFAFKIERKFPKL